MSTTTGTGASRSDGASAHLSHRFARPVPNRIDHAHLAGDHIGGRYNAINSAAFQAGAITGPIAAGLLLDRGGGEAYVAVMVLGCVAVGAFAILLEFAAGRRE